MAEQSPEGGSSTASTVPKSGSNTSVRLRKSLSFQQTRSRSRSTEEDVESEESASQVNNNNNEEQSLEDVAEDPESGDSETATEVEVSEKALKFKISTEPNLTGRKSYPGSRKGSRERVQHLNTSDLARVMMQKGKLRAGALSFDHHCLLSTSKKLSFDAPDFLDEYAITLKKKLEDDCVEATNSSSEREEKKPRDVDEEEDAKNGVTAESGGENAGESKIGGGNKSILAKIKYFTDKIGLSDSKSKLMKNNNSARVPIPLRKKLESPCCKSLENVEDRRASTLPKTKKSTHIKKNWKHFIMGGGGGREKATTHLGDCWVSDVEVNKLEVSTIETDNHSLPSTSRSSCVLSPKAGGERIVDNNVANKVNKLQEMHADQVLIVSTNENDGTMI